MSNFLFLASVESLINVYLFLWQKALLIAVRMPQQQFEFYVFIIFACTDVSFPMISFGDGVYKVLCHSNWNFISVKMTATKFEIWKLRLLNKVLRVPKCPSALNAQVPSWHKCPSSLNVQRSWYLNAPVLECLSTLSARVFFECPTSALWELKCLSSLREPFECSNEL